MIKLVIKFPRSGAISSLLYELVEDFLEEIGRHELPAAALSQQFQRGYQKGYADGKRDGIEEGYNEAKIFPHAFLPEIEYKLKEKEKDNGEGSSG